MAKNSDPRSRFVWTKDDIVILKRGGEPATPKKGVRQPQAANKTSPKRPK